jgi:hypothetical protein
MIHHNNIRPTHLFEAIKVADDVLMVEDTENLGLVQGALPRVSLCEERKKRTSLSGALRSCKLISLITTYSPSSF